MRRGSAGLREQCLGWHRNFLRPPGFAGGVKMKCRGDSGFRIPVPPTCPRRDMLSGGFGEESACELTLEQAQPCRKQGRDQSPRLPACPPAISAGVRRQRGERSWSSLLFCWLLFLRMGEQARASVGNQAGDRAVAFPLHHSMEEGLRDGTRHARGPCWA